MAQRKTSTAGRSSAARPIVIQTPAAPPARRRRASKPKRKTSRRRKSSSAGPGSGQLTNQALFNGAIGGFGFGFIEKQFPNLPTLPVVGRAGTIAIAARYLGKGVPFAAQIGFAAAVIAGYQMGTQGHVLGDVVPQVHGVASQV